MADGDQNIKHMPIGNRRHAAKMGSDEEDDDEEEEADNDDYDDDDDDTSEGNDVDTHGEEESGDDADDVTIDMDQFIRTFHFGDYDNLFDDALSSDRTMFSHNVLPPFRPTQASYNKPNNWSQINRLGLMTLQEQLQTCINNVTHKNIFNLELRHNRQDNDEAHFPIVWHEPFSIVNDYWDELEEAFDRKKNATHIRGIHIQNVELKNFRLAMLVDVCSRGGATNSSSDFIFDNANLCADGIISLSELVDVSSKLIWLFLHHNRIDNMDSAHCLSRSLKLHSSIIELNLAHCDLGCSPEILLVILKSDVIHIDLSNNNIDSLGAVKIAEYLEGNPPIQIFNLDRNRLNDDDVIIISLALKSNTNLNTINLLTNNFTSIGVKALLACVVDSSSLNAISESNHTLERIDIFLYEERDDSWLLECIDNLLRLDRMQKIVLALQDKDSLLQYLANVPIELIPEVLAFALRQIVDEHQHKYLNIVYSTMRWWNMPMLYSYYHCVKSDTKRKRDD